MSEIGNSTGNPQVYMSRPVPILMKTYTHVPMGTVHVGRGITHGFDKGTTGFSDIRGTPMGILSNRQYGHDILYSNPIPTIHQLKLLLNIS
jgi:hypothetical protein